MSSSLRAGTFAINCLAVLGRVTLPTVVAQGSHTGSVNVTAMSWPRLFVGLVVLVSQHHERDEENRGRNKMLKKSLGRLYESSDELFFDVGRFADGMALIKHGRV